MGKIVSITPSGDGQDFGTKKDFGRNVKQSTGFIVPTIISSEHITQPPEVYLAEHFKALEQVQFQQAQLAYFRYLIAFLLKQGLVENDFHIAYTSDELEKMKKQVASLLGETLKSLLTIKE